MFLYTTLIFASLLCYIECYVTVRDLTFTNKRKWNFGKSKIASRSCLDIFQRHHLLLAAESSPSPSSSSSAAADIQQQEDKPRRINDVGLYKRFADHAWEKLEKSGWFQESKIPLELKSNEAEAKGTQDSIVRITAQALEPVDDHKDLVRYARVALLETISLSSKDDDDDVKSKVQSAGIQVLNFVIFPSQSTTLPVLGIDLVSLPGNRNLLLLDAQPMTDPNIFENSWKDWYASHVEGNSNFPWGGDFPDPVQQYVSKYALWTRLQELDDPISVIENDIWDAFTSHLDIYMNLLQNTPKDQMQGSNNQAGYLLYRRNNDPAKPMLNSLYGSEWTDRILDEVLFPRG